VCRAHLFVRSNKVRELNVSHGCSGGLPGRKRNYRMLDIENVVINTPAAAAAHAPENEGDGGGGVVENWEDEDGTTPTTTAVQGRKRRVAPVAQEYSEKAKLAGFHIGRSQTYKAVTRKRNDTMEVQVGQYLLPTSMLDAWRTADPHGTYILQTVVSAWEPMAGAAAVFANDHNRTQGGNLAITGGFATSANIPQFHRYYITPSIMKHTWRYSPTTRIILSDTSIVTSGSFAHTMLLAITYDGNDKPVVLAYATCDVSVEDNWVWFLDTLNKDFPGVSVFL
jgi:hypothetical protein